LPLSLQMLMMTGPAYSEPSQAMRLYQSLGFGDARARTDEGI
jgi:hypothetical protein